MEQDWKLEPGPHAAVRTPPHAAARLAGFLYDVGTTDPTALAGASAVLLAAGLLAAYIPAHRASRIDPAGVLREQ